MKKLAIILAITLFALCPVNTPAEAGYAEFILSDYTHPTQGTAGLFMQGAYFGNHFSFQDVRMTFATTHTGTNKFPAYIKGSVVHQQSGESWSLAGRLNNFRFQPGVPYPGVPDPFDPNPTDLPYDGMFDDWITTGDRSARLFYDSIFLRLTPDAPGSIFNNGEQLVLRGKQDGNGDTFIWNYQRFTNPGNPVGDVFGATSWFYDAWDPNRGLAADLHFVATPANAVPEPGTMALMGFGLSGIGFLKRKRQKKA